MGQRFPLVHGLNSDSITGIPWRKQKCSIKPGGQIVLCWKKERWCSMRKGFLLICLLSLAVSPILHAGTQTGLREGWQLQSACKLQAAGDTIATDGFSTDGWLKTAVPSTVLAAQAAAGVFPDPYYGMNLRQIPGTTYPIGGLFANLPMDKDSPYRCGWWYRTAFTVPAAAHAGERQWLHFGGINYRGEVWLNGHKIADTTKVAGAYRTYDFDVTEFVKPGKN